MFDFNITLSGRIRRRTYWMTTLLMIIINILLVVLLATLGVLGGDSGIGIGIILAILFWFANLLITISLQVRRLHDTGKSGAFILLHFVPFGSLILLIFFLTDSAMGPNQYGPNPKGI